jgi:hypothetical protein
MLAPTCALLTLSVVLTGDGVGAAHGTRADSRTQPTKS